MFFQLLLLKELQPLKELQLLKQLQQLLEQLLLQHLHQLTPQPQQQLLLRQHLCGL